MLRITVFQEETHRAQVAALGLLEQCVLDTGERGFCSYADGLFDTGVLRAPAAEGALRDADLFADLRLRQTVHGQPLQPQQSAGAVPFADLGFSCQNLTSERIKKTVRTGSTLEEPCGRRMTRVRTVLAMMSRGGKGVENPPRRGMVISGGRPFHR